MTRRTRRTVRFCDGCRFELAFLGSIRCLL